MRETILTHPEEFTDTDPRPMEVWLELLRQMPPGEKMAVVLSGANSFCNCTKWAFAGCTRRPAITKFCWESPRDISPEN